MFLRYALVGLLINVGGYLFYLLITWLGAGPKITLHYLHFLLISYINSHQLVQAVAILVVAVCLFVMFRFYVFPRRYRHGGVQ